MGHDVGNGGDVVNSESDIAQELREELGNTKSALYKQVSRIVGAKDIKIEGSIQEINACFFRSGNIGYCTPESSRRTHLLVFGVISKKVIKAREDAQLVGVVEGPTHGFSIKHVDQFDIIVGFGDGPYKRGFERLTLIDSE